MEKAHTNDLTTHLKALEHKGSDLSRRSRRQEIIKLRAEVNKIEAKKIIQRINETKSWFFVENQEDKPLSKLIKRQRENNQINKLGIEKRDISTDMEEI